MSKPWSEPGTGRWFKIVMWLLVAALVIYFVFRLGTGLARRFRVIKRVYEVGAAQELRRAGGKALAGACDWSPRPTRTKEDKRALVRICTDAPVEGSRLALARPVGREGQGHDEAGGDHRGCAVGGAGGGGQLDGPLIGASAVLGDALTLMAEYDTNDVNLGARPRTARRGV